MSYQTRRAAIGPYPVNCCGCATRGLAGIAAIDDVASGCLLSICQLTSLLLFAIDPAVDGFVVTPLFSIADVAIVSGSRDTFDLFILLPWQCIVLGSLLPVLSTPWLIPTLS
jgi:hypothetical protein